MNIDPHQKAYICVHVFDGSKPVTLVSRPEGDWCFLCGEEHDDDASAYRVVGIGHMFDQDPSLEELKDLPEDWEAEREKPGSSWIKTRCEFDN